MRRAVLAALMGLAAGAACPAESRPLDPAVSGRGQEEDIDTVADSRRFKDFVLDTMKRRGVDTAALSGDFHSQLRFLAYETARGIPADFHVFSGRLDTLSESEVARLFGVLGDEPERLPEFILVSVHRPDLAQESGKKGSDLADEDRPEARRLRMPSAKRIQETFQRIFEGFMADSRYADDLSGPRAVGGRSAKGSVSIDGPVEAKGPAEPVRASGPPVDARFYYEEEIESSEEGAGVSLENLEPSRGSR